MIRSSRCSSSNGRRIFVDLETTGQDSSSRSICCCSCCYKRKTRNKKDKNIRILIFAKFETKQTNNPT